MSQPAVLGTFEADLGSMLEHPPRADSALALIPIGDSVYLRLGMLSGDDQGELELTGVFVDSATVWGRWIQIYCCGPPYEGGVFQLRRNVR